MKRFLFFICIFAHLHNCSLSFAQQNKIDSLENIIKQKKQDTTQAYSLNKLSILYSRNDPSKAMEYAEKSLQLANQLHYYKGIADAYNTMGNIYSSRGDYDKGKEYYKKSLKLREQLADKKGIATAIGNIGIIYFSQGKYEQAIGYYLKSMKIWEEINDRQGIALCCNYLGALYYNLNKYDKGLEYFQRALQSNEELGNKEAVASDLGNIGSAYYMLKQYDLALQYYLRQSKAVEELNNKGLIALAASNIGGIYSEKGDFDKAMEYKLKSFKIREQLGEKRGITENLLDLGDISLKQKKYNQALRYLEECLKSAQLTGNREKTHDSYESLALTYFAMNNFKSAYQYAQLHSQIKDSIFNMESSKQIAEMQTKYETEKKEQQIKLLNKDKEIQSKDLERQKTIRNAVAGGLVLVLFFSFVLINRLLLIRKQKKVIEIEREKSEKLLLNILPKETADELKRNNAVTPKRFEQVTVMFTDFKGFTTIAEKMSAEELVGELDFIFKRFDEIISKYPIEKIKTIGDAYMCAGGLPVANTTNPFDVVLAALEIQEFMKAQNKWQLRLGIHTGSVIAGVVGDKKFAYDIWGDTVNTASRMESSGEAGRVNISGDTYKLLTRHPISSRPPMSFTYRGKIPAKNKGEIEMYFVERKTI